MSSPAPPKSQPKPKISNRRAQQARRRFLRSIGMGAGIVGVAMLGYYPVASQSFPRLRPPGALAEKEYLASCIKCGQCVQVCPVKAIELADAEDGFGLGAAWIDPRKQGCDFSCDGLQCVLACPTGALTHETDYPHEVHIGIARLDKPKLCLAVNGQGFKGKIRDADFQGRFRYNEIDRWNPIPVRDRDFDLEICDLCVRHCPIEIRLAQCEAGKPPSGDENQCPPQHAIKLEPIVSNDGLTRMKPVILDGCVGCGACEMVCPTEPAAIVIDVESILKA